MVVPVDAIRSVHNAFRKDMAQIDTAILGMAREEKGSPAVFKRFRFFSEVLDWQA